MRIKENEPFTHPVLMKMVFIFAGIVIGFLISRIFFQTFTVADNSMAPNLLREDRAIIFKTISPGFGSIVLFKSPGEPGKVLLKRVIALPGDVIELRNREIYLNSEKIRFKWRVSAHDKRIFPEKFTNRDNLPPLKIGAGKYFVIGDNIDYSFDSREFGPVSGENIIGRLILKY